MVKRQWQQLFARPPGRLERKEQDQDFNRSYNLLASIGGLIMPTARMSQLSIENYRSIGPKVEINFPARCPLVLFGENNSGKSNIVRALNLILGTLWPG